MCIYTFCVCTHKSMYAHTCMYLIIQVSTLYNKDFTTMYVLEM